MKTDRVQSIIDIMDENEISPYEISQHTNLTYQAILRIKTGESKKPRSSTLDEIESYLEAKINKSFRRNDESNIILLERQCLENWDSLMERPGFKAKVEGVVKDEIILRLEEIISRK